MLIFGLCSTSDDQLGWLAILSQSNPLFQQNSPLWVIFSRFGVKGIKKVEKLKNIANVPPQK